MFCADVGAACYRVTVYAKDISWRKIIYFETSFHSTAQAGLKLLYFNLSVLWLYVYHQT